MRSKTFCVARPLSVTGNRYARPMRVLALMLCLAFVVACSEEKPDANLCSRVRHAVRNVTGPGAPEVDCPGALTNAEAQCIRDTDWIGIMSCPGFAKLGIDRRAFEVVYCYTVTRVDADGVTTCTMPWSQCDWLRENMLKANKGITVSECEVARNPWRVTFACSDGRGTCVEYFASKTDCEKRTPSLRQDANNVGECLPSDTIFSH